MRVTGLRLGGLEARKLENEILPGRLRAGIVRSFALA